jgi:hypothetical protein
VFDELVAEPAVFEEPVLEDVLALVEKYQSPELGAPPSQPPQERLGHVTRRAQDQEVRRALGDRF